ncbi:MAG: hypothetical protein WKF71_08555 [Pyrinomonadaceae bacterium]
MKKFLNLTVTTFFLCVMLLTASVAEAQVMPCAQLKATTLPTDYGNFGQLAVTRNAIGHPDATVPAPVSVFVPGNATAQNRRPVVFFAHGFGGFDYRFYEGLLRQLTSNGYIVVFAPYTPNLFTTNASRYQQMWSGFQLAVERYGNLMDTSRVGFAGHSYGAGALPEMTKRGVALGWGANGLFIFSMAPWFAWGSDFGSIPAKTKLVVQIYWEDGTNEHLIAQNDVWNKLAHLTERKWQTVRSAQCRCTLKAGHSVPVTSGEQGTNESGGDLNAQDYWSVWRRLHALSDYTFNNNVAAKDIAFGVDARSGRWRFCALRPITPLEATDAPVVNPNQEARFRWTNKCLFADPGTPCSL